MDTILQLGSYDQNISVMRLLPPEIAFRYHALPVATDGQKVTVAMAPSDDQQAISTIQQVIDAPVCFIQADPLEIDLKLSQLWPSDSPPVCLLAWLSEQEPRSFLDYVQYLAGSLNAELELAKIPLGDTCLQNLKADIQRTKPTLFLYSSCHSSRMVKRLMNCTAAEDPDIAFLKIPINPLQPISRILLVLPELNKGTDRAINWAVRFAQSEQVQVTVLPVLPPIPLCYGCFLKHNLEDILTGNDPLGQRMRDISSHFQDKKVVGLYKLREGDPLSQIRDEVLASDPDLIIIPTHLRKRGNSWMTEDLGSMLFKFSTKPILNTIHKE